MGTAIIETERLALREFVEDDAEALHFLKTDPQVMRYTGEPLLLGGVEAAREALAAYPDYREHGYGRWACVLKQTGAVIGFAGLKYLPEADAVDVGYRFRPEYWGRGLATESALGCLEHGFGPLALERIIATVLPGNAASIRVLDKLGMSFVDEELTPEGDRALLYEILRCDWIARSRLPGII